MRSLKMTFGGKGSAAVEWNREVAGFAGLTQKAVNNIMTQAGSDDLVVGRGTNALKELAGHGAFDLMAMQHTLNFAAQKAASDVVSFETSDVPQSYSLGSLRMLLSGVVSNAAQARIIVTNSLGETTNDTITIS